MADLTLPDAIEKAKVESRANKGTTYHVNVDADGWCHVDKIPEAGMTSHSFKNGAEVPVPNGYAIDKNAKAKTKAIKDKPAKVEAVDSTTTNKVMTTKTKVKKAKAKAVNTEGTTRGNNMKLTTAQWGKVDARLKKDDVSFSSFSRGLVLKAIGE